MKFEEFKARVERAGGFAWIERQESREAWVIAVQSRFGHGGWVQNFTCSVITGPDDSASVTFWPCHAPMGVATATLRSVLLFAGLDPDKKPATDGKWPSDYAERPTPRTPLPHETMPGVKSPFDRDKVIAAGAQESAHQQASAHVKELALICHRAREYVVAEMRGGETDSNNAFIDLCNALRDGGFEL